MLEGENIVSAARKAIVRHDFSTVLTVFPILRHLKQTKPEFDQVLQVCGRGALENSQEASCCLVWPPSSLPGRSAFSVPHLCSEDAWRQLRKGPGRMSCSLSDWRRAWNSLVLPQGMAASTKNKLPGLITSMETIGAKALEDFADNIKVPAVLPFLPPSRPSTHSDLALGDSQRAGLQEGALSQGKPAAPLAYQHPCAFLSFLGPPSPLRWEGPLPLGPAWLSLCA